MFFSKESVVLILTVVSVFFAFTRSAPVKNQGLTRVQIEEIIHNFLDSYYEKYIGGKTQDDEESLRKSVNIYDTMQGDQAVLEENDVHVQEKHDFSSRNNTDLNVLQASRNRLPVVDVESRAKDSWIQLLKMNILQQVGRGNNSALSGLKAPPLNLTQYFPNTSNDTNPLEDFISKKIRTFYPSCSVPEAANQEFRVEEKMMNLYFNYTQEDQTNQIAEATLRLHVIPVKNSTHIESENCTHRSIEEEKVYRISAYYYVRAQKNKRRAKKRLCDSRVIAETSKYVELNMANAVRAWNNEQNLGLAVEVEDQDGKMMNTEKYFVGPSCSVGVSTPKPIPSVLMDESGTPEQFLRLLGRNTTLPFTGDILLLPTLEVCTLGYPITGPNGQKLRTRKCNLIQFQQQAQKVLEKDKLERLATLKSELRPSASTTHRHLRHQRNYLEEKFAESDTKILMTKEQVFQLLQSLNLTSVRT